MGDNLEFRYYYMDALEVAWLGHTNTESPGLLEEFVLVKELQVSLGTQVACCDQSI